MCSYPAAARNLGHRWLLTRPVRTIGRMNGHLRHERIALT